MRQNPCYSESAPLTYAQACDLFQRLENRLLEQLDERLALLFPSPEPQEPEPQEPEPAVNDEIYTEPASRTNPEYASLPEISRILNINMSRLNSLKLDLLADPNISIRRVGKGIKKAHFIFKVEDLRKYFNL